MEQATHQKAHPAIGAGVCLILAAALNAGLADILIADNPPVWHPLSVLAIICSAAGAILALIGKHRRAISAACSAAILLPVIVIAIRIPAWYRYGINYGNVVWAVGAGLAFLAALVAMLLLAKAREHHRADMVEIPIRSAETREERKRPTSITVICALSGLGAVISLVLLLLPQARAISPWYRPYLGLSIAVGLVCLVGLWKMKRWAAFTYVALAAVNQIALAAMREWSVLALVIPAIVIAFVMGHLRRMT